MRTISIILIILFMFSCGTSNSDKTCHKLAEKYEVIQGLEVNLCVFKNNLKEAKKYAKETGKPIFTIYGCWGCMSYTKGIWEYIAEEKINKIIRENFIVCYLYADDRTLLKDQDSLQLNYYNKPIKTIGDSNLNYQVLKYNNTSQPLYTITNSDEVDLAEPIGYFPFKEKKKFLDFLKKGLKKSNTKKNI